MIVSPLSVYGYLVTMSLTVSFLHPQQPYKTTIFDRELTANNYRNILDI